MKITLRIKPKKKFKQDYAYFLINLIPISTTQVVIAAYENKKAR